MEDLANNNDNQQNKYYYCGVCDLILCLWMISGILSGLLQLVLNLQQDVSITICLIQFIGAAINLYAFILIYRENKLGFYIYVTMMLYQIPINLLLGRPDLGFIVVSALVRIIMLSLVLLIPNQYGIRGWTVLWKGRELKKSME